MADILVTSPFQPFTLPTQFKAVFNGFIYCGTVDAVDPSVSQVQVYLVNEDGDKVPVAQPLRTNAGGFLVYNGQPAKFVTDSNHSLLVQDSFHVQVWYAPDVASVDPESAIEFILNSLSSLDGAGLVGSANYAQIRAYNGTSEKIECFGRENAFDGAHGDFYLDESDNFSVDNDGTILIDALGRRWKRHVRGHILPEWFGAKGDGVTNNHSALTSAISYIRSIGGGVLDLGEGGKSYGSLSPIRLYSNMRITGRGYLIALAGFSSAVSFPTYGTEVPQVYNTLLYFNDGTHADDPTNFGYRGLEIDAGVEVYGNFNCDNGLIMEGITNYRISGRFQKFNAVGIYPKYYCWGGRINAHITDCVTALLKLGEAANGVDLNGLQAFGGANNPTYGIQIVGDNNGINLAGAFVEKMINGVYWTGLSGPATISGVDFEDCFGDLITIDGTGLVGRAAGPVTVSGSFLEATNIAVKCINAVAIVTGCRIRDTPLAFSTSGDKARIYDIANEFEGSVTRSNGGNIISDINGSISRRQVNHLPNALNSLVDSYRIENNSYGYNVNTSVNELVFSSILVDVPTQRMLSSSTWETREMRNGSVFGVMGLKLDYSTGAKVVTPRGDNDHSLGSASLRFSVVYAGTGTINTSDAREKTDPLPITHAVLDAWGDVQLVAFKWLDSIRKKGEDAARWHFGVIAQQVRDAFLARGLDGRDYGLLCFDEWEDVYEQVKDDDGNPTDEMRLVQAAGNRWGIRADQCLFLEAAYQRRRCDRIEARLTAAGL